MGTKRSPILPKSQTPLPPALPLPHHSPAPRLPLPRRTVTPLPGPIPAPVAAPPPAPAPAPTPVLPTSAGTQFAPAPAEPLLDELKALSQITPPDRVRRIAARLAAVLNDPGSLGCYIATLSKVVAGTLSRDKLLAAYKAGLKAVGKARSAGAIFQWTLANYTPPPKPSEVRYYQQPSAISPQPPTEAELQGLRDMIAGKGQFTAAALQRVHELKLLGIDLMQG